MTVHELKTFAIKNTFSIKTTSTQFFQYLYLHRYGDECVSAIATLKKGEVFLVRFTEDEPFTMEELEEMMKMLKEYRKPMVEFV